ncbi:sensor histidine kinase [Hymenobacter sp. GOD-10R]|uniref:sensor histidine kinase n=1 Tax=Hymenobacter sp. GOD-10R TaxID=3093922 RepID=UPI002D77E200|nr:histidine kinase [Hymenobacter sp. GOD-10R]WRQ26909.1 histidine kinase [Hymenobacter sp. GOD-10R]
MASSSLRRYVSPLTHALVWSVFGLALVLFQPRWHPLPIQFWIKQASLFFIWIGLFYLNSLVWVPRLLFRERTLWFILVGLSFTVAICFFSYQLEHLLHLPELFQKLMRPNGPPRPPRFVDLGTLLITLLVLGISTSTTVVQKWQHDAQLRQELEQQRTKTELSFLKAQINPHFFFNTLNNIYALTAINVELARQALHTLSRMMRYVLYETQASTTLLSQEIAFLQDYMALMQLRLTDKVTVTFSKPEPLHDVPVAPMLLLPFVENAFKHGVSATQPSQIHVSVQQCGTELALEVRNTLFPKKALSLDTGSGIGLTNTRRRLDLLYPERYHLTTTEATSDNEFQVMLTLQVP